MGQTSGDTTRPMAPAWVASIAVGAVVLGFALGAVVGWPLGGGSATPAGEHALMCASLDEVEPSFAERLEDGDVDLMSRSDDDGTVHLLLASVNLAEAAALARDADADLQATARDLRASLARLEGAAVGDHLDELRQYC